MDQKPKHTESNKKRTQALYILVIVVMIGLFYAWFNYQQDQQARAIGNIFKNIVEELNPDDTATPTPVPTYMLTLTAFSATSSPSSLDTFANETASSTPSTPQPEEFENNATPATPIPGD